MEAICTISGNILWGYIDAGYADVYLVEVVKGLMQVGQHASGWFISDLNGGLQDTLHQTTIILWGA